MTNTIRIELKNEAEVIKALTQAGQSPGQVLDAAVQAAAEIVRVAAAGYAPGPHIDMEKVEDSGSVVSYDVGPTADNWHYRFFEFGTSAHRVAPRDKDALHGPGSDEFSAGHMVGGIAPQPFLRPAIDENENAAADAAGAVIRNALP